MLRAMQSAATGMSAQEKCISVIANNLANVNTPAFKSQSATFEDLFYETFFLKESNEEDPAPLQIGHGTRLSATPRNFAQGELEETGAPLDIMILGDGFFKVLMPDGNYAYTRDGSFKLTGEGKIVTSQGFSLEPEIFIPEEATNIIVSPEGLVSVIIPDEVEPEEIGEILPVKFLNPQGLEAIGSNLYKPTQNSGDSIESLPGIDGIGLLSQGYLERSNVRVVDEMVRMILAQRAYEINSKVISTADRMFAMANSIVR